MPAPLVYDDPAMQARYEAAIAWLGERWVLHRAHSPVRRMTQEEWEWRDLERVAKEMQE